MSLLDVQSEQLAVKLQKEADARQGIFDIIEGTEESHGSQGARSSADFSAPGEAPSTAQPSAAAAAAAAVAAAQVCDLSA